MDASIWLIAGNPIVSLLVWLLVFSVLLYLARHPAHRAIQSASNALSNGFRLAAHSLRLSQERLVERNREVLLNAGRESAERMIEREFERIGDATARVLSSYPALQRQISEEMTRIQEDHQKSAEVPPAPPSWAKAVEAVASIQSEGDSMVAHILSEIHASMQKAQEKALTEYRKSSQQRHKLLSRMVPYWRKLVHVMERVDKDVRGLLERSRTIDRHIEEYQEIVKGSDRAQQVLASSSLTQFFISAFVLAIAVGGAIINFHLIARPMQEMVGGNSYIIGFKTANIAALVIIFVEMAMGLFLMESLRITRLFPVIGALDDKKRVRMIWVSFSLLFVLASIEASLAYMRDILSQDDAALIASLVGQEAEAARIASSRWITTAAQMGMGFILPFALTFVAIPLESFIHSMRTVLGMLAVGVLGGLSFLLRFLGSVSKYAGAALVQFYDLIIFVPLWVERLVSEKKQLGSRGSGLSARGVSNA